MWTPETHHHIFFPAVANVRIHIVGQALYRSTMIKHSGSVVAVPSSTFPPFSHTSYYSAVQCSRHCVWPRISHIWHLSSPPLYPSLPTCPQRHPSFWSKNVYFWETFQKKPPVLPDLQPYLTRLGSRVWLTACCIISMLLLHFLPLSNFSTILFAHSFTDFNGQEEIAEVASYVPLFQSTMFT